MAKPPNLPGMRRKDPAVTKTERKKRSAGSLRSTSTGHGLPTRAQILEFIAASPIPVGKREIARAFKVNPADRVALKGLIKDIQRGGLAERGPGRRFAPLNSLPEVVVAEVTGLDEDGLPILRPLALGADDPLPPIQLHDRKNEAALGVGERAVLKLKRREDGGYDANIVRKLERQAETVLGVFRVDRDGGGTVNPADHSRRRESYKVRPAETLGAQDGELVVGHPLPIPRLGLPHIHVTERLGMPDDPRAISMVAIHSQGIPTGFSEQALAEAARAKPVALGQRTDLRPYPLITIDGADARDFDDAVFAEPDKDVEGGWHLLVAIADVSWYVRPGGALDRDAAERGNSVYFPDRVVPMLPEALSNELCSLKPQVERACMAIHIYLDADGEIRRHRVVRGLMRSIARLTYEQVQAAIDGNPDETTAPLVDKVLKPLYGAYSILDRARAKRGTLELDLPERRVRIGGDGTVAGIEQRERLDSHKLIEEFMIAANVAAAETLEKLRQPCMYRVHDRPDPLKVQSLSEVLDGMEIPGLRLAKGQVVQPKMFNRVLSAVAGRAEAPMISELVLRSQAQAIYSPDNLGHFGLALQRYAHFTSPIRRYADLLVHRALIRGLSLGDGALPEVSMEDFAEQGLHLSRMERRASAAERQAVDRYMVCYLASQVGAEFGARVNGVTRFGLFVTLNENGADGLIPIGTLPQDYYNHDEQKHRLVGQRSGRVFNLGDRIQVKLIEADPVAGKLLFHLVRDADDDEAEHPRPRRGSTRSLVGARKQPSRKPKGIPKRGGKGPRK